MEEKRSYNKIYMTMHEIRDRLKRMGGEINEENVNALAELNNCKVKDMWDKLGETMPPKEDKILINDAWLMEMYGLKYTDRAMAEETGIDVTRIRLWRVHNNLPAINRRM